jgi:hypothetical protein
VEVSQKEEGLNVRMAKMNRTFMSEEKTTENTPENYLCEDKPEAESKTQGEVEPHHATNGNDAGMIFF